jgi:hypothetical protein
MLTASPFFWHLVELPHVIETYKFGYSWELCELNRLIFLDGFENEEFD